MASFSELINGEEPVLVDFFATWCGPCKTMSPIIDDVAGRVQGKARVLKVDVDKAPQAMSRFGIRGVPTLILFKNGEIKWRQSGVVGANDLEKVVMSHAS